jgi:hypothetical protein
VLAVAAVLGVSAVAPPPARADGGLGGVEGSTDPGPGPLTPEQEASRDLRLAQVEALINGGGGIAPMGVCEGDEPPPCQGTPPAQYALSTHARHQHRWFYCGPAVVQVISNYTWGYTSTSECGAHCGGGVNKYGQHTISDNWTDTDVHGQTYVGDLVYGLNQASVIPDGFIYAYWESPSWSEFHGAIKVDTYTWRMPLAPRVDPRHTNSSYYLYSWRNESPGDYGHYIVLRGYNGSSQSTALAYYNDSSGGVDEHTGVQVLGDTGAFDDYSYTVWQTMYLHKTSGVHYLIW